MKSGVSIKQTEKLLHERKELIEQAESYLQYRDYHKAYKQTKPKKQEEYAESEFKHRVEFETKQIENKWNLTPSFDRFLLYTICSQRQLIRSVLEARAVMPHKTCHFNGTTFFLVFV